jgi:hypothetical protein
MNVYVCGERICNCMCLRTHLRMYHMYVCMYVCMHCCSYLCSSRSLKSGKAVPSRMALLLAFSSCMVTSACHLVGGLRTYMVKLVVKCAQVRLNASMKYASTLGSLWVPLPEGGVCVSRIRVFTSPGCWLVSQLTHKHC